jgi:hypothetical protein
MTSMGSGCRRGSIPLESRARADAAGAPLSGPRAPPHGDLVAGDGAHVHVRPGVERHLSESGPARGAGRDLLTGLLDDEVVVRAGLAEDADAAVPAACAARPAPTSVDPCRRRRGRPRGGRVARRTRRARRRAGGEDRQRRGDVAMRWERSVRTAGCDGRSQAGWSDLSGGRVRYRTPSWTSR